MQTIIADAGFMGENFFRASGLADDFAAKARMGIYVHVPFCPHICPYCDFVKTSKFSRADVQAYFSALEKQCLQLISEVPKNIKTVTLYLGGGTPSLFTPSYYQTLVQLIRDRFEIEEFTVETNPFSNLEKDFAAWVSLGVNRITLGAQSLDPRVLKYLGRKHSADEVISNVSAARAAGIDQVQVDFIFGVKKISENRSLAEEVRAVETAGATGVSCYLLTIEDSTHFASEQTASDETVVDEYQSLIDTCHSLGFIQHETSNFSRMPSIHNRLYWYGLPYLGLGTGAHGLLPSTDKDPFGRRYRVGQLSNRPTPGDDHLPFQGSVDSLFSVVFADEKRTRADASQELLLTLLRTQSGLPLRWMERVYMPSDMHRFWNDQRIKKAIDAGYLLLHQDHLRLSPSEKLRGDSWSLLINSLLHP